MAIYLKLANIKGDVKTRGYEKTIELYDTKFSAHCEACLNPGQMNDRQVSAPRLNQLEVSKLSDSSSCAMFAALLSKTVIPTAEIYYCHVEKNEAVPNMSYVLSDVIITSYVERSMGEESLGLEDITLSYIKIEKIFNSKDSQGRSVPFRAGYHLGQATLL